MKAILIIVGIIILLVGAFLLVRGFTTPLTPTDMNVSPITVMPIEHATAVIQVDDTIVYTDPVGDVVKFAGQPQAQVVLVTDIHQDHFNAATLEAVAVGVPLIVPQAVRDQLPESLLERAVVLANGESTTQAGLTITAVPMYNHPDAENANFHTPGRGNGYIVEKNGIRLYVAGDTAATEEMKSLANIETALVPMNLPYTMSVEEAAEGVAAFAPKHVYPYHYRGPDGLADVNRFKELVNTQNPNVDVVLLNWYP